MADPSTAVTLDTLASDPGAHVTEQHLVDFLAETQATALANSTAAQYANPAALGGRVFQSLRGYVQQTKKIQQDFSQEMSVGNTDVAQRTTETPTSEGANLHGGPAKEGLLAGSKMEGVSKDVLVTIEEMGKLADKYTEIMKFGMVTQVVVGGSAQVGQAVNSLTKGQ
jgi:hypothetical protein